MFEKKRIRRPIFKEGDRVMMKGNTYDPRGIVTILEASWATVPDVDPWYLVERDEPVGDGDDGLRDGVPERNLSWIPTIPNLGAVLSILALAEVHEIAGHDDIAAFYAPSECHADFARGEEARFEEAHAKAERMAGKPMKEILREARFRGMYVGSPKWDDFIGRVNARHNFHARPW